MSFFWSRINTESQISAPLGNADGLPIEIGGYRGTFIPTYTTRLNYDRTLSPTLLLHLGAGYYHTRFSDKAPFLNFDPSAFGLSNFLINRQFPSVTGMCVPSPVFGATGCFGALGGMQNIGTSGQIQSLNYEEKPTFTANTTWIKGQHTFKFGAEMYLEQGYTGSFAGVTLATGTGPTSEPFTPTGSLNGNSMGFGFASFLLGDYSLYDADAAAELPRGQSGMGTLCPGHVEGEPEAYRELWPAMGLSTPEHEQYGRLGQFSPNVPNTNAGGAHGGTIYANTCNCQFYQKAYPWAFGPRLGVAYQLDPKTVLRGGWGVNYQFQANPAGAVVSSPGVYPLAGVNPYVNIETPGSIVSPTWPVTNPSIYPIAGTSVFRDTTPICA